MRPIKLTMQGFTSFAERAEVDFSGLDLFAITGPTGSGKTSVLDAMTWALYGKTPRLGKCGAELITHGRNSVAVHFEFALGTDRYRIARTAKRAGSPQVRLEQWCHGEWIAGAAGGVRETADAICKLVGLDFDAFKLSVILPQGDFDRFLRGDHAQRRTILKSLLGLEVYDRMREIAWRRLQDHSAKEALLQDTIARDFADATEEYLNRIMSELRDRNQARLETAALLQSAQELCILASRIETDRTARAGKAADRSRAGIQLLKAGDEAKTKADEAEALRHELESAEREHDAIVVDETRAGELVALKTRAEHLANLLARQRKLQKESDGIQALLAGRKTEQDRARKTAVDAEAAHRAEDEARDGSQKKLDALVAGGSADLLERLAADLRAIPERQEQADAVDAQSVGVRQKERELRATLAEQVRKREALQAELEKAKQDESELTRHSIHRELRAGLETGKPCPVCEQTVSALPNVPAASEIDAARQRVKSCDAGLQKLRDQTTRAETELAGVPATLANLDTHRMRILADVAALRERVHAVTGRLGDQDCALALASRIAAIDVAEQELNLARKSANVALETARKAREKAAELDRDVAKHTAQVAALTNELNRLSEDIQQIQPDIERAGGAERIIVELQAIETARTRKAQIGGKLRNLRSGIDEARTKQQAAERETAILAERVQSLTAEIAVLDQSAANLEAEWTRAIAGSDLPEGDSETQRATRWRELLQRTHDSLQQRIAQLQADVTATKDRIDRLAGLTAQLTGLQQERSLYEQVHGALRADRFIDHLLGRAYDDLCTRGSAHLLRLSGERYSFTAAKNTFNVKDAWNGDAERPAATLSGGESFYASLALALALADIVASFRADGSQAARLEALFLDEGVSTLDQDEALPAVVDALTQLQASDRMIGVISHMENLAQRLPARIEILKNHGRSTISTEAYAPPISAVAHVS